MSCARCAVGERAYGFGDLGYHIVNEKAVFCSDSIPSETRAEIKADVLARVQVCKCAFSDWSVIRFDPSCKRCGGLGVVLEASAEAQR